MNDQRAIPLDGCGGCCSLRVCKGNSERMDGWCLWPFLWFMMSSHLFYIIPVQHDTCTGMLVGSLKHVVIRDVVDSTYTYEPVWGILFSSSCRPLRPHMKKVEWVDNCAPNVKIPLSFFALRREQYQLYSTVHVRPHRHKRYSTGTGTDSDEWTRWTDDRLRQRRKDTQQHEEEQAKSY